MRCRVQDNSFVTSVTGATRFLSNGTAFINTLFFRNHVVDNTTHVPKSDSIYLSPGGRFVNCTFAHNSAKFYSHNYNDFYNCVFSDTAVGDGDGARHQNRVNDSTSVRGLIAPVFGDVRVRAGSSVVGAGNAAYAADESIIPCQTPFPVERMKDLYGNAIPTSGAICAGCAQEEVVPAAGAVAAYNTGTFFDLTRQCRGRRHIFTRPTIQCRSAFTAMEPRVRCMRLPPFPACRCGSRRRQFTFRRGRTTRSK